MEYPIRIETKKQGTFTRKIMAANYSDALEIGDRLADEIDGHTHRFDLISPPDMLTFDELMSGQYGESVNYYERGACWMVLLGTGWIYTGKQGEEVARRCSAVEKIDASTIRH